MSDKLIGQITTTPTLNGNISQNVPLQGTLNYSSYDVVYDKNYVHVQSEASDEWVIVHNLNKYPSVSVIDSAGDEVIGDVHYDSVNQVTLTFEGSFKGRATLN